jgi:hypothetical protein
MLQEAQLTKSLYKLASQTVGYGSFTRAKREVVLIPQTGFSIRVIIWPTGWQLSRHGLQVSLMVWQ